MTTISAGIGRSGPISAGGYLGADPAPKIVGAPERREQNEPESGDSGSSLNAYERETVINLSDGDSIVRVWSAQRTVIHALRNRDGVTEVECGHEGKTEWAAFEIPIERFKIAQAVRPPKRQMTEAQREVIKAMRAARDAKAAS